MNRIHPRTFTLRVARFATVALTLLFIAALYVPTLSAQIVAPAGSVIGNQATATYTTLSFLMALLEMRLLEDSELPFTKHEALATSGNVLHASTPLGIV